MGVSGRAVAPADKVAVRSLYGGKIDTATVTTGNWNQIGTEDADAIAAGWKWDPCPADDKETYDKCYMTASTDTSSQQDCAISMMMYMEADGVAPAEVKENYNKMKEEKITVHTGFRAWDASNTLVARADAAPTE